MSEIGAIYDHTEDTGDQKESSVITFPFFSPQKISPTEVYLTPCQTKQNRGVNNSHGEGFKGQEPIFITTGEVKALFWVQNKIMMAVECKDLIQNGYLMQSPSITSICTLQSLTS